MLLNLIFLFFIACMPFVASLLGFSMALIWLYASKNHRLIEATLDAGTIRTISIRLFVAPLMFLVAVPFAYVSSTAVIIVWWLSPLVVVLASRILTQNRTKQHSR